MIGRRPIMYQKMAEWIDSLLVYEVPKAVTGFYFCLCADENEKGTWNLDLIGTSNFSKDPAVQKTVVHRFNEESFTFNSNTQIRELIFEIRRYIEKYLKCGNYGGILKRSAGVAVADDCLTMIAVAYKNKEFKQEFDFYTFLRKLALYICVIGGGILLSAWGGMMAFVWDEGPGLKTLPWGSEINFNNSQSAGLTYFMAGICLVAVGLAFILKGVMPQLILGLVFMMLGFGIPVINAVKYGAKYILIIFITGILGVFGLYIFMTYFLRLIRCEKIAEKMDGKISDWLMKMVWK